MPGTIEVCRARGEVVGEVEQVTLECEWSKVSSVNISDNQLTSLGALPPNLYVLEANDNPLDKIPDVPSCLHILEMRGACLVEVDFRGLDNLTKLNLERNFIRELPSLPPKLVILEVGYNQITRLPPTFPETLTYLNVGENLLTSIPPLPRRLEWFVCAGNRGLKELPELAHLANLEELIAHGCALRTLPVLPEKVVEVGCDDNPFPCGLDRSLYPGKIIPEQYFTRYDTLLAASVETHRRKMDSIVPQIVAKP